MNVPCQVSAAEMREAYRLNLTKAFWWKAALGNFRTLVYFGVLVALIGAKLAGDASIQWTGVAVIFGLVVLFFALYLITAETTNGTRTFTPWAAISRWREGKLVFTIGEAKAFRTVPKGALGEMQSAELRSLLLSQIREPTR